MLKCLLLPSLKKEYLDIIYQTDKGSWSYYGIWSTDRIAKELN